MLGSVEHQLMPTTTIVQRARALHAKQVHKVKNTMSNKKNRRNQDN